MTFPYHPAYGLTDDMRAAVLRDAEIHGVAVAATLHNVSLTSAYKWRAALKQDGSKP
jgi:hypothetical protein